MIDNRPDLSKEGIIDSPIADDSGLDLASTLDDGREQPESKPTLARGMSVGRYLIVDQLGEGGMGVVYKAFDPDLNRPIALKILSFRDSKDSISASQTKLRTRLLREAQAMAKLSHPNVITVYDVGTFQNSIFIAMELVEGQTLRQWLEQDQTTDTILQVVRAAGRGLQAAHHAGIIHRDFKPENVIVTEDLDVRVLDFGLARAAHANSPDSAADKLVDPQELPFEIEVGPQAPAVDFDLEDYKDRHSTQPSSDLLSTALTLDGAVIGTPYYIAPEQYLGLQIDERSDQFSFCVVLFEAFFRSRPFQGRNRHELAKNVLKGRIQLGDRVVDEWIKNIILKGLQIDPSDRFSSMEDLLEALGHDPQATRQKIRAKRIKIFVSVGFVLVSTLAAWGFWYGLSQSDRMCQGASKKLVGIWDDTTKEQIQRAFQKTGRPYAGPTFQRVAANLDTYFDSWVKQHTTCCQATFVHGEQSEHMLDLRMRCLNRRLDKVAATVALFRQQPQVEVVDNAVKMVSQLESLEVCHDTDYLKSVVPLPADPNVRTTIAALFKRLDQIEALERGGQYQKALGLAEKTHFAAQETHYAPVRAEALYHLAVLYEKTGRYDEAETRFYQVLKECVLAKKEKLAAKTWAMLIFVLGYRKVAHEKALAFQHPAELAVLRANAAPMTQALVFKHLGSVYLRIGDFDQAATYFQKNLDIQNREFGTDHIETASALTSIGLVAQKQAHFDKAKSFQTRAMKIWEDQLGHEHPMVAISHNNLGIIYRALGQYDMAEKHHLEALSIRETVLGKNHPDVATSLNNLGALMIANHKPKQAIVYLKRALEVWKNSLGPKHPSVAKALGNLGNALLTQGKCEEALAYFEKSKKIMEAAYGPDHPTIAKILDLMSECHTKRNQHQLAIEKLEQAITIWSRRPANASQLGATRFSLAQAVWAYGKDKKRALVLARQALSDYKRANDASNQKQLEQILSFLRRSKAH